MIHWNLAHCWPWKRCPWCYAGERIKGGAKNTHLKRVVEFVLKLLLPDALAIFAGAWRALVRRRETHLPPTCWIACLNYETLNISMKNTPLVVVRGTESEEILTSARRVKKTKKSVRRN